MYIACFDESGDDGIFDHQNPNKCSKYFIYSNFYLPDNYWKIVYRNHQNFRKALFEKEKVNFTDIEFHTREFIQARDPYFSLFGNKIINPSFRRKIVLEFCRHVGELGKDFPVKIITTAIPKFRLGKPKYPSENLAIEYSLRENLTRMWLDIGKTENFMMVADQGREKVVRKYARKLQVYNLINGKDNKLENMLEDALFKDSQDSYFLQIVDLVSYLSYLWITKDDWTKNIKKIVNQEFLEECFTNLKPVLNQKATNQNTKAIVIYPK